MTWSTAFVRGRHGPRLLLTVLAALVIGPMASSATAGAQSSLDRYALAGVETRATNDVGTFVGGAGDSTPSSMLWKAVVRHTQLTRAGNPAVITGGGVTLQVWSQKRLSKESHIFSGGTISYVPDRSSGSGCGQQVFRVTATLATSSEADDSGLLDAYLTHYRRSVFGRCITYAATVHGSLTLAT